MPTDPWLWDSSPVPASRPAIPVTVARYDSGEEGGTPEILDNIECVEISQEIGIDPGRASFRYIFDGLDEEAPQSIEDALGTGTTLPKTIQPDDELIVYATPPGGDPEVIFHGKAMKFGMTLDEAREEVHIIAVGWAKVLWNTPMAGARVRDASDPTAGADFDTDIPAQFNPKGLPNATVAGSEAENAALGEGDYKYPTFIDPLVIRTPSVNRAWTLALAARYIIYRHAQESDKVTVPTGDELDGLLVAREPKDGAEFDPTDSSTFDSKDIVVGDQPLTGRDWPGRLNELIRDRGFGMAFDVATADDGSGPETTLRLFLLQGGDLKDVYLQERGSGLDPEMSNVASAEIERDANQVINQWKVVGALQRYEGSFILPCAFTMQAGDAATFAAISRFDKNAESFNEVDDAYRLFAYDETGDGHYAPGSATAIKTPGPLDEILGATDNGGNPTHGTRRRKPIGELISTDADGKPYRAKLSVSLDSTQVGPAIWDGTGTWQDVDGQFALCKDRLGIRVTAASPNAWSIGKSEAAGAPYPAGVVKLVEAFRLEEHPEPGTRAPADVRDRGRYGGQRHGIADHVIGHPGDDHPDGRRPGPFPEEHGVRLLGIQRRVGRHRRPGRQRQREGGGDGQPAGDRGGGPGGADRHPPADALLPDRRPDPADQRPEPRLPDRQRREQPERGDLPGGGGDPPPAQGHAADDADALRPGRAPAPDREEDQEGVIRGLGRGGGEDPDRGRRGRGRGDSPRGSGRGRKPEPGTPDQAARDLPDQRPDLLRLLQRGRDGDGDRGRGRADRGGHGHDLRAEPRDGDPAGRLERGRDIRQVAVGIPLRRLKGEGSMESERKEERPGIEQRPRAGESRGPEVESLGSRWRLAPLGLARAITEKRDSLYDDLTVYQEVGVRDIKECAYLMLNAAYFLTPEETVAILEGAEFKALADAVIDGIFVDTFAEADMTYTKWARSALLSNGIDPAKLPKEDTPGVLRHLVETHRAIPLADFTAAGRFQALRGELLELV